MEKLMVQNGREQRKVLFRLLTYAGPHKKAMILAFFLLFLATVAEVAGPFLIKIFIDDYLAPRDLRFAPLFLLAVSYIAVHAANSLFTYMQQYKFQEIAVRIVHAIRVDVYSKVQSFGLRFFDKTPAGSIVSRVTNDTEAIKDMFVTVLVTFVQSTVLIAGILGAMYLLNTKLAVLCTLVLPVLIMLIAVYRKYSTKIYFELRERLSQLNTKLNETLQGMNIIQHFRQEQRFCDSFQDVNSKHYRAGMKNIKVDALLLHPATNLVYITALALVLSYFGITALNTTVEIGVIYAYVNYLGRFFRPVNELMMHLSLYQQAIVSASRVFDLLDKEELAPVQTSREGVITEGEIEFRNVSFSYDGRKDVLRDISFTAKRGETVALVGHTGSGKSTIVNLLLRFYDFDRGDILIDGKSIRSYPMEELREKIGLVLQDPFIFYGTVEDNIRLYNNKLTKDDVEEAARFVQAEQFIKRLSGGYRHHLSEKGLTLSSGQRQLISFARTMARDPQILVLDEATANIDTETEEAIQEALVKMRKGRTTIAIAHRLSTIQDADQILVLHKGRIVERGTHQELLAKRGLYYKMYLLQNGLKEKWEEAVR